MVLPSYSLAEMLLERLRAKRTTPEVIDPDSRLDYSRPTRIQFDFETFEVGPLTVIPGPLPSIVFATARPPGVDAERIVVQYGDVEFKGIITPGERP